MDSVAVALALASGLIGAIVGALIAGGFALASADRVAKHQRTLAAEEATRVEHGERKARLRIWQMAGLQETRDGLLAQLSWHEQRVLIDPGSAGDNPLDTSSLTRSNINLLGDPEVIREYTGVMVELSQRLPMTWGSAARARLPRTLKDLDTDMLERTTKLRARVIAAIDAQERRVLSDEPILVGDPNELSSIAGADAMLDNLRERQGRGRSS